MRLLAGKRLAGFETVRDSNVLERMAPEARRRVIQVDLKRAGIADLGDIATDDNRLELFYRDQPMTLARWPNEGFVKIADVLEPEAKSVRGIKRSKVGKFFYDGNRPLRWLKEKDLWLHGYWYWDWSPKRQRVDSIDPQKHLITLKPPASGDGYRQGQWYYAFNALSELDEPGEWYLDGDTHVLYFWPPGPLDEGTVVASVLPSLVELQNVSHVELQGLFLEASRGAAVRITECTHCKVTACTIRNCGDRAVNVWEATTLSCRAVTFTEPGPVEFPSPAAIAGHWPRPSIWPTTTTSITSLAGNVSTGPASICKESATEPSTT